MNLSFVILNMYLLFPPLYQSQELILHTTKNNFFLEDNSETKIMLEKYFYGDDFENPLDDEIIKETADDKKNSETAKIIEELHLKNNSGRLVYFEYGQEKFSTVHNDAAKNETVDVNDLTFSRSRYDEKFRIIENIVWKNGKTLDETQMLFKTTWEYSGEVIKKQLDVKENFLVEFFYNKDNFLSKQNEYDVSDKKNVLLKSTNFLYDEKNRLKEKKIFSINEDVRTEEKYVYDHSKNLADPDMQYFENGILRSKIIYDNENSYTEFFYFDNNYSVKAIYEKGIKVRELIISNGVETERARRMF